MEQLLWRLLTEQFVGFGHQIQLNFWLLLCEFIHFIVDLLIYFSFSATKASIVGAIIFIIDKKTDWISAPHALVYFGIVIFFVYFKLSSMILGIHDPFLPFENLFCAIFFGGIWDALARLVSNCKIYSIYSYLVL